MFGGLYCVSCWYILEGSLPGLIFLGQGYRLCIEVFLVGYNLRSLTTIVPSIFLLSRLVLPVSEYFTMELSCPYPKVIHVTLVDHGCWSDNSSYTNKTTSDKFLILCCLLKSGVGAFGNTRLFSTDEINCFDLFCQSSAAPLRLLEYEVDNSTQKIKLMIRELADIRLLDV
jgi:hypothetical protein